MNKILRQTSLTTIAASLILALGGCALGPDYERPDLAVPTEYNSEYKGTENNLAMTAWEEFYLNPELQELIKHGLDNNIDLAVMQSRLRASRANNQISRSKLWPEFGIEFDAERSLDSELTNTDPTEETTIDFGGVASWELDIWGANRRGTEASYARYLSTAEQVLASRVSLISDIATAFYELADINQRLKISIDTVTLRGKELELARLRHDNGMISGLDVRQAEVEYQTAKVSLPQLKFDQQQKRNQILILLGEYDYPLPDNINLNISELPDSLAVGIPSTLLSQRPDVRAAEQQLIAANADVGIAKAAFFPSFTIEAVYGQESDDLSDIFDSQGVAWSLLGGITAPIFNAGRISAQYDVAQEEYKQLLLNYRSTVLNAYVEVKDSMNDCKRAQDALIEQKILLDAAAAYVHLARLRYQNGVATSLDFMDAQRQYFSAELSYSRTQRDQLLSLIQLYRSLGGGVPASLSASEYTQSN